MRILLMTAMTLALGACSGASSSGGSYYCYSDGPSASNLVVTPDTTIVGEGGNSVDVTVAFDYRSRSGMKIIIVRYRIDDAAGRTVFESSHNVTLKGSGPYSFSLPVATQAAGNYSLRVRLVDECYEQSKWLAAAFDVLAATALEGMSNYASVRVDNLVYFVGGRDSSGEISNAVIQYDIDTGVQTPRPPLPEGRELAAAAAADGIVYVFGGYAFGFEQASSFAYDPAANSWTAIAPMSQAAGGAIATTVEGMIYIEGPGAANRYDPVLDLWTAVRQQAN